MNYDNYDITDNGDGTFTLTPKTLPSIDTLALVIEYRSIRDKGIALLDHRSQINDRLTALAARRDEIKAILQTAGIDGDTYTPPEGSG